MFDIASAGPFLAYRGERVSLRSWAPANVPACLRRYEVTPVVTTPAVESQPDRERVRTTYEVVVSYPRDNRFGDLHYLDATIAADLYAIDYYVGQTGTPPAASSVISRSQRREYAPGVVFGVLTIDVEYWRAAP